MWIGVWVDVKPGLSACSILTKNAEPLNHPAQG
jgi:hypothetical protein